MTVEELFIYFLIVMSATVIGIPLGSWLNSKLLTRTWKGELTQARKEISQSKEYREATELVRNLNNLLNSEEARNFFKNTTELLQQLTNPFNPNKKPLIKIPPKPGIVQPREEEPT